MQGLITLPRDLQLETALSFCLFFPKPSVLHSTTLNKNSWDKSATAVHFTTICKTDLSLNSCYTNWDSMRKRKLENKQTKWSTALHHMHLHQTGSKRDVCSFFPRKNEQVASCFPCWQSSRARERIILPSDKEECFPLPSGVAKCIPRAQSLASLQLTPGIFSFACISQDVKRLSCVHAENIPINK